LQKFDCKKHKNQTCCSVKCARVYFSKKEIAKCHICSKEWMDYPYNNKRVKHRFCSKKCVAIFTKMRGDGWMKNQKGNKASEITKKKMGEAHKGDKNPSWKGGITPINTKIRRSQKYRQWREKVFNRDKFTCKECEKIGGRLHAHHIKPFSTYPKLRFSVDNGITLCRECHRKISTRIK